MSDSTELSQPTLLPPFTRAEIRAIVEDNGKAIRAAVRGGENAHQMSLDHMDAFTVKIAPYPEEQRNSYLEIYTQELNARAAAVNDEADRINAETAAKSANADQTAQGVAALIIFGVGALLLWLLNQ